MMSGPSDDTRNKSQGSPPASRLPLDPDELLQIVSQALGRSVLSLRAWNIHPLHYAVRSSTSAGLYRIHGTAELLSRDGEGSFRTVEWSLILKVVQPSGGGDVGDWNYWCREAMVYQSGLLERLVTTHGHECGVMVPRCWNVAQQTDGRIWLWLEDIAENDDKPWPLERYGLAARHFGAFQGAIFQSGSLPSDLWLSRGWMRARVASFTDSMRRLQDPGVWDRPLVRQTCPRSLEGRLMRLWDERGRLLDALDRLPQTLCHFDMWRPNLLSRAMGSEAQTVVLDWSYTGVGALGQDIGNLVPDSVGNFDIGIDQAKAMDEIVFAGYLQGLRESGRTDETRLVRLGYAASAALGWGLGTPWWLVWPSDAERQAQIELRWGRPLEELLAQRAIMTEFVLDLADEALGLIAHGTTGG